MTAIMWILSGVILYLAGSSWAVAILSEHDSPIQDDFKHMVFWPFIFIKFFIKLTIKFFKEILFTNWK